MGLFDFVGDIVEDALDWVGLTPEEPERPDVISRVNKSSNIASIPVVYGTRLISGGTRVILQTKATDANYLYMAIVLCEGEIENIVNIYLDDKPLHEFGNYEVIDGPGGSWQDNDVVVIQKFLGTDSQTSSTLLQESGSEWSSDHKLSGLAYLAIRLRHGRDGLFRGIPEVSALIEGRKIYDPRNTSTYFSNNYALCVRDYLTNTRYGKGLPASAINDTAFITAANDADNTETVFTQTTIGTVLGVLTLDGGATIQVFFDGPTNMVGSYTGAEVTNHSSSPTRRGEVISTATHVKWVGSGNWATGQAMSDYDYVMQYKPTQGGTFQTGETIYINGDPLPLYSCNTILDTSKTVFDNMKSLLFGMRGIMPYTQGKYSLLVDKAKSSSFDFNERNIIGGITINATPKKDRYNRVTVKYVNPSALWQDDTVIYPDPGSAEETTLLAEDNGTPLHGEKTLTTCTSYFQSRDFARMVLYKSRNGLGCTLVATSEALECAVGDVVTVTHPTPGWSSKEFSVTNMSLNDNGEVKVALREYDSGIYTYQGTGRPDLSPDTTLPDPFDVASITGLTLENTTATNQDGIVVPAIEVSWTASASDFVKDYEIRYKLRAASDYQIVTTTGLKVTLEGLVYEGLYDIGVRGRNYAGIYSAWDDDSIQLLADTTAPDKPTLTLVQGENQSIRVKWDNPTDSDFRHTEIYHSTSATIPGVPTMIAFGDEAVITGLLQTTYYYVWIKAVDNLGNSSAPADPAGGTGEWTKDALYTGANWIDISGEGKPDDNANLAGVTSIVLDPTFSLAGSPTSNKYWDTETNATIDATGGSAGGPCALLTADGSANIIRMTDASGTASRTFIPASYNQEFTCIVRVWLSSDFNGPNDTSARIQLRHYNQDFDATGSTTHITQFGDITKNVWQIVTDTGKITDLLCRYVSIELMVDSTATAGTARIDDVNVWSLADVMNNELQQWLQVIGTPGDGINRVLPRYCGGWSLQDVDLPRISVDADYVNVTSSSSPSPTSGYYGQNALKIQTNAGATVSWIGFTDGSWEDYNIAIDPNSEWLVRAKAWTTYAGAKIYTRLRTNDAGAYRAAAEMTLTNASQWYDYTGTIDCTSDDSDKAFMMWRHDSAELELLWLDGIMMEKKIGDSVTASDWRPSIMSNTGTGVVSADNIPTGNLGEEVGAKDGTTGITRTLVKGLQVGYAYSGTSITFDKAWDTPPIVAFLTGGLTYQQSGGSPNAFDHNSDQYPVRQALNVTKTGFSAQLRLQTSTSSPILRTDTTTTQAGDNSWWTISKSQSAQAWDDTYKFTYTVRLRDIFGGLAGKRNFNVSVGVYVRASLVDGWVLMKTDNFHRQTTDGLWHSFTQVTSVVFDGLGQVNGDEFRVAITFSTDENGLESEISDFTSVQYYTGGVVSQVPAAPSGGLIPQVPFLVML